MLREREFPKLKEYDEILWCEMLGTDWKELEGKRAERILSGDSAEKEKTQVPAVSQLERMSSCQILVGNGWSLQLGDFRGAFWVADSRDREQGPLCSSLPLGGSLEMLYGVVILILGNIYGWNDAPQRWWKNFDAVMCSIGVSRSTFDVCVGGNLVCSRARHIL